MYTTHFYNPEVCSDSSQTFKLKTECYYHVTYVFQNERTLYSSLNVKEFLARNWRDILSLSDSNGIRTHSHLVRKWTLNHLPFSQTSQTGQFD